MLKKRQKNEKRTESQLKEHYEIEKELAKKLRNASTLERKTLYSAVYDELYKRVPHHQQLSRKKSPKERTAGVLSEMAFLRHFLHSDGIFLEVGPGDCALSFAVAKRVKEVYAIDVSNEITKKIDTPINFSLILSDGSSIPLPSEKIDVAYSNQLMEHLHPDDAGEQLRNIYAALIHGGVYICITPNRLSGPWDISMYFDPIASGFHLKEYTYSDLGMMFRNA